MRSGLAVTQPLASVTSRDLRTGGRWTRTQRIKNDILWGLASLALAFTRPWPLWALRKAGCSMGYVAHAALGQARRTAFDNVTRVWPEAAPDVRRALVRRCFATLGELLADAVALGRRHDGPRPIPLTEEALRVFAEARAEGRGVVFASAHLGPWERVAASLVAAGLPLVTLARESYDPRFSALYAAVRARSGVRVIWRASPQAAFGIVRALRRNDVLGVPMDLRARVATCMSPFMGHPAPTAIGPAVIALRGRAPVVVGTVAPRPGGSANGRARGKLGPNIDAFVVTATRVETSDLAPTKNGAAELTHRINAELSRRILAIPEAWVWMHERWTPPTHAG